VCCVCVLVHFADQKTVTRTQHTTQAAGTACALCVCVCVCCVLCVCVFVCVLCVVCVFLFTLPTRSQSPAPSIQRRLRGQCVRCVLCVCPCSLCRPEASYLHPACDAGCRDSVCVVCVCVCLCVCCVCCVFFLVHFADQKPVTCTQHTTQAAGTACVVRVHASLLRFAQMSVSVERSRTQVP